MQDKKYIYFGILGIVAITLVHIAILYTNTFDLFFDEAQYWDWAKHIDVGYYSKPPLLAWLIAGTTAVCGDGEACIRLSSPLLHTITALILTALATKMFNAKAGFWVGLSYITVPAVSFSSLIISTDVPLLCFWALALYCFYSAVKTDKWQWWIELGVCIGLGMLSKYAMLFFVLSMVIFFIWQGEFKQAIRNKKLWLSLLVAFLVYAPNIWWNYMHHFASYLHTKDNASLDSDLFHPIKLLEFIGAQFGVFGPILFATLLIMAVKFPKFKDFNYRFLLAFCLPLIVVMCAEALLVRANANWAVAAYISGIIAVVAWLYSKGKMKLLYISLGLHVLLALILYTELLCVFGDSRLDLMRRAKGWDVAGQEVSAIIKDNPGVLLMAEERKILTPFLYYVHPFPAQIYKWNPEHRIKDHYDLTTDMNRVKGKDFLLVTRWETLPDKLAYFRKGMLIKKIIIPIYDDYKIELYVFKLMNFKGY